MLQEINELLQDEDSSEAESEIGLDQLDSLCTSPHVVGVRAERNQAESGPEEEKKQ